MADFITGAMCGATIALAFVIWMHIIGVINLSCVVL